MIDSTGNPTGERGYKIVKAKNGWILSCGACYGYIVCDTYGEAFDHIDAEEKKFPNDE